MHIELKEMEIMTATENSVSDGQITRNLTVLFGFFFVFLTTLITSSMAISGQDLLKTLTIYIMGIGSAIGGSLVGMDLRQRFIDEGISELGSWGISFLVIIIPAFSIFGVAIVLGLEPFWWIGGVFAFFIALVSPYLADYYRSRSGYTN